MIFRVIIDNLSLVIPSKLHGISIIWRPCMNLHNMVNIYQDKITYEILIDLILVLIATTMYIKRSIKYAWWLWYGNIIDNWNKITNEIFIDLILVLIAPTVHR